MKYWLYVLTIAVLLVFFIPVIANGQLWPNHGVAYDGAGLNDGVVRVIIKGDTTVVTGNVTTDITTGGDDWQKIVMQYIDSTGIILQGQFPPVESSDEYNARASDMVLLPDGRFAVAGYISYIGVDYSDGLMIIFNSDLTVDSWVTYQGTALYNIGLDYLAYDSFNDCLYGGGTIADTGVAQIGAVLVKYSLELQPLWSDWPRVNGTGINGFDCPTGLVVDTITGNVFLSALLVNVSHHFVGTVVGFDSDGNQLWIQEILWLYSFGLLLDPQGRLNIFGGLYSENYSIMSGACFQYSTAGDSLDGFIYEQGGYEYFVCGTFDDSGNRYLGGTATPVGGLTANRLNTVTTDVNGYSGRLNPQQLQFYRKSAHEPGFEVITLNNALTRGMLVKHNPAGQFLGEALWGDTLNNQIYQIKVDYANRPVTVIIEYDSYNRKNYFVTFDPSLEPADSAVIGYPRLLVVSDFNFFNSPQLVTDGDHKMVFGGTKQNLGQGLDFAVISLIPYMFGDANGDGLRIGADVVRLVNYFKGQLEYGLWLLIAGDCNGDCATMGADVTFLVAYFRGLNDGPPNGSFPYGNCIDFEDWFADQIGP